MFFGFADCGERIELVLDYIVERKRMDDLAGSIVDGRFREQKVLCILNQSMCTHNFMVIFTPSPIHQGTGYCFRSICIFVSLVSLLAKL